MLAARFGSARRASKSAIWMRTRSFPGPRLWAAPKRLSFSPAERRASPIRSMLTRSVRALSLGGALRTDKGRPMAEAIVHVPEDVQPDAVCEGGNLDCGSGLLLLIRKAMNEVAPGGVLEIRSTEISVREDLPAWCRMTKNPYLGWRPTPVDHQYYVRRGGGE